jgi:hypothetical protein
LGTFVGRAWSGESGLSVKADLRREAFDTIASVVDPEFVVAKLKAKYGSELDTPEFHLGSQVPYERQLAHQFAAIHQHVKGESQPKGSVEGD